MKHTKLAKALIVASLLFTFILAGTAFAEPELRELRIELFTAGDFPEYISVQTFAADSFDNYLYEHLKNGTAQIDISDFQIPEEDIEQAITMVVNDHPDLFFVSPRFRYYPPVDYVNILVPEYLYTGDDLAARQAAFDASVKEIAAYANKASTTIGKLLRVNDYFCTNYQYDTDLGIFRPDQLFSGGKGVCQAYMLGYNAVLDELGIANTHATSSPMNHTWSMVNVGQDWYHIDVTWNDPLPDTALQASHNYFLLSDEGMLNSEHYDWISNAIAQNTAYDDCFWRKIYTPLAPVGDHVYYLSATDNNANRSVMDWNASTGASSSIVTFSTLGLDYTYSLQEAYAPVAADSNCIYYGARGVLWAVDHAGNNAIPVYSAGDDNVHILSCSLENGTIFMRIKNTDNSTSVVSCPADQRLGVRFDPDVVELLPGETTELVVTPNMILPGGFDFTLTSTDPSVVSIDANNNLTAVSTGAAYIIASSDSSRDTRCPVIVHSADQIIVPAGTIEIGSESFFGSAAREVILPGGLQTIGSNAFASCDDLALIHLPDSVENIDASFIPENASLILVCRENSSSADFAQEQGIPCVLLPD